MKRNNTFSVALAAFFIGSLSTLVYAGERLTKEEVRQLITGNTIEEVHTVKPWQNKIYFPSDAK